MRINKYLANKGVGTRREVDALVEKGKVTINGRVAVLGDKVSQSDQVEVRESKAPRVYRYYAFNKPVGVITHSPQNGELDARSAARLGKEIFPVGRLDKNSSGLILLTNDGRVTERLLSPSQDHDKEYRVRVREPLRESFRKHMEAGVTIEGYTTRPCSVRVTGSRSFVITLTEGKKHQIRRMVAALHNEVESLERTRILSLRLGSLKPGELRPVEGAELATFLTTLGLA